MFLEKTANHIHEEVYSEPVDSRAARLTIDSEIGGVLVQTHPFPRIDVEARLRGVEVRVWHEDDDVFVTAERLRTVKFVDPKAELFITVPEYCELQAMVVTGSLEVNDLNGALRTHVITGQTELNSVAGRISASAVTGSIKFAGRLANDLHRFVATTGSVVLDLDNAPDARIYAWATTGRVQCDLPLDQQRRGGYPTGDHLYGVCGSGTGRILAEVTTGSVHITGCY